MGRPRQQKPFRLNLELSQVTNDRLIRLKVMTDADSKSEVIRRALEFYEKGLAPLPPSSEQSNNAQDI